MSEFGSNAVSNAASGGTYIFIDEYWHYIQQVIAAPSFLHITLKKVYFNYQILPDGTQLYPPTKMVTQQCRASATSVYRVNAMQYDYKSQALYGAVMVPNNANGTYDSKISVIDVTTVSAMIDFG